MQAEAGAGGRQRKSKKKCEKAKREKNNIIGKLDRAIMAIEREREGERDAHRIQPERLAVCVSESN